MNESSFSSRCRLPSGPWECPQHLSQKHHAKPKLPVHLAPAARNSVEEMMEPIQQQRRRRSRPACSWQSRRRKVKH
ncbi:unnamed protein product [Ectocarpus sp. 8 AP-2014]